MNKDTENYVKVFNNAARNGDWAALANAHTEDGVVEFDGVPLPPARGRAEIEAVYREHPQSELVVLDSRSDGDAHELDYKFVDGSGTGRVRLTFRDGLVTRSVCTIGQG